LVNKVKPEDMTCVVLGHRQSLFYPARRAARRPLFSGAGTESIDALGRKSVAGCRPRYFRAKNGDTVTSADIHDHKRQASYALSKPHVLAPMTSAISSMENRQLYPRVEANLADVSRRQRASADSVYVTRRTRIPLQESRPHRCGKPLKSQARNDRSWAYWTGLCQETGVDFDPLQTGVGRLRKRVA
jgi:hypothetical protein